VRSLSRQVEAKNNNAGGRHRKAGSELWNSLGEDEQAHWQRVATQKARYVFFSSVICFRSSLYRSGKEMIHTINVNLNDIAHSGNVDGNLEMILFIAYQDGSEVRISK
jgi:hypothetical protein